MSTEESSKKQMDEFWEDYYKSQSKLKSIVEYEGLADYCSKAIEILKPKMKKKQKASVFVKPKGSSLF